MKSVLVNPLAENTCIAKLQILKLYYHSPSIITIITFIAIMAGMGGATERVVFLLFRRTLRVEEKERMLSYVGSEIFHSCAPELGGARVSRPKRTQLYVLTSVCVV